MEAFKDISDEYNISIIGDAAQAHGASIGKDKVGTLADIECFSFYPTKNMTTGEGGMVTTNDEELFRKMNSIRNHGRPNSQLGVYEHDRFGLNLRLTDIGSAIGRVQLRKLEEFNSIRMRNATILTDELEDSRGILCPRVPKDFTHAWHQYTIRVKSDASGGNGSRDLLSSFLRENGIGTGHITLG